jgi:hypothetical protein
MVFEPPSLTSKYTNTCLIETKAILNDADFSSPNQKFDHGTKIVLYSS